MSNRRALGSESACDSHLIALNILIGNARQVNGCRRSTVGTAKNWKLFCLASLDSTLPLAPIKTACKYGRQVSNWLNNQRYAAAERHAGVADSIVARSASRQHAMQSPARDVVARLCIGLQLLQRACNCKAGQDTVTLAAARKHHLARQTVDACRKSSDTLRSGHTLPQTQARLGASDICCLSQS